MSTLMMNPLQLSGDLWLAWFVYWMTVAWRTKKTVASESLPSRVMHLGPPILAYVAIFTPCFDYGLLGIGLPRHGNAVGRVGVALTVLGLGFAIWARIHLGRNWSGTVTLKENHQLIRSGPYALARHPIYTGMFLATLGSVLCANKLTAVLAFAVIVASFFRKLRLEERFMLRQFGTGYERYRREVRAVVPFLL